MSRKPRKPMHPQRFLLRKLVAMLNDADAKMTVEKRENHHEMVLTIPQVTDPRSGHIIEYEMIYRLGSILPEPTSTIAGNSA